MHILDSRDQVLRCKTVQLVKVLWQHRGVEEVTWDARTRCGPPIISYLRTKVCGLIYGTRIITAYACVCVC